MATSPASRPRRWRSGSSAAGLTHLIAICDGVRRSARDFAGGRALDAAIVRMAMADKMADVAALIAGATSANGSAIGKK